MLAAEGETVVYISPHGQREQGKDVISIGRDKVPCCYQLKGGRVALSDWRKYHGEVNELVTYPIEHPSISSRKMHRPYFVTNGTVADPVLSAIASANRGWTRLGAKKLHLIARDELVSRFVKAHGSYLPRDPKNFRMLLDLIARDGYEPFAKSDYARFVESILPVNVSRRPSSKEIGRIVSSAILLTTYAVQPCERENNHWAVFEAWVMAASYILAIAQKYRVAERWWGASFDLAELASVRALESLAEECEKNHRFFTQGNALSDAPFYGPRITVLCGLLASLNLYRRLRKESPNSWVHGYLTEYLRKINLWGEAAVPHVWAGALEVEQYGHHTMSEGLLFQVLKVIVEINARRRGPALPNPYWGPEASVRHTLNLDVTNPETFNGVSYTAEPLIDFFVRRLARPSLASLWEKITKIQFAEFSVTEQWEYFRWRAHHGSLRTSMPKSPESWNRMLEHVKSSPIGTPSLLNSRPQFAILFALVFPHRFTCDLTKVVEGALGVIAV
jgi:hypothetical protein